MTKPLSFELSTADPVAVNNELVNPGFFFIQGLDPTVIEEVYGHGKEYFSAASKEKLKTDDKSIGYSRRRDGVERIIFSPDLWKNDLLDLFSINFPDFNRAMRSAYQMLEAQVTHLREFIPGPLVSRRPIFNLLHYEPFMITPPHGDPSHFLSPVPVGKSLEVQTYSNWPDVGSREWQNVDLTRDQAVFVNKGKIHKAENGPEERYSIVFTFR